MNFEKIEQAYDLLLENVQLIENELKTTIYDALIEQNSFYLGEPCELDTVVANNQALRDMALSPEEWRRAYQFLFIKAGQTEPLQANHQFTPDSIGFLLLFLVESLLKKDQLDVLEIGSGTGNLGLTFLNNSQKKMDYLGMEVDDLLIDLAASIAEVMQSEAKFIQEDAVRPHMLKESDLIISDLPIGYYPDDQIASRYQVAAKDEHTYAHHLLMEQALKYLKQDGLAIFLAPVNLLTSPQGSQLKTWLTQQAQLLAMISLPETLFGNPNNAKSIFILKKKSTQPIQTLVYHLADLQNPDDLRTFMENFQKWRQENEQ
ncbi:class I SAM-dependent methyltransferase [Streptococcus caprae]|uniref:Class I SAM-dependent methyltransferase n=1 Tax=Streptococcus caprae TaxID=1640501 RepID=A0ABV8CWN7_9STRE